MKKGFGIFVVVLVIFVAMVGCLGEGSESGTQGVTEAGGIAEIVVDMENAIDSEEESANDAVTEGDSATEDGAETEKGSGTEEPSDQEVLGKLEGKTVNKAMNTAEKLGYTVTFLHDYTEADLTLEMEAQDKEVRKTFVVTRVGEIDTDKKTVVLFIDAKENIAQKQEKEAREKALTEKLDPYFAWEAVQEYGERQYPYGFKLHNILGQLAQEAEDENTWFLKATCTCENAFGNEYEGTCEAKVTGTSDAPEVVEFLVY